MAESFQHQQLVQLLKKEVLELIPSGCQGLIQQDTPASMALPPKTIEGFRPDIYYCFEGLLIIGEAKTSDDVERQHSRTQYAAYIKECAKFQGKAVLIIAVPWMERASANNIVQNLKKKILGNYTIRILEWIGGAV
jgi:hypothetical protein